MKKFIVALSLISSSALAQAPSPSDQYWQQLIASKEAQSSQQIVSLAQQLDAARKQIIDLQKQLEEKSKGNPHAK